MNRLTTLADAAKELGYATGDALRRAFARRLLPSRFLLRTGPRTLRVDVDRLIAFLRDQAEEQEGVIRREVRP